MSTIDEAERLRRWRLILGAPAGETLGIGQGTGAGGDALDGDSRRMDRVLAALYDNERSTGGEGSMPSVARWLGDIRTFFPTSVVQVMQQDALERLNLTRMLTEPELLEAVTPDVQLVATLLSLNKVMPEEAKATARKVVRSVVDELLSKLRQPLTQAVRGSLNRATTTSRPRFNEIDWDRTIRANLKHYLPEQRTIIPERLVGHGRKRTSLRDVVLCMDQSGSMLASVVYAGIFGAVLASLPALSTRMVVYDTAVVDLTEELRDPVDLLFGVQLGGGNDTPKALRYCQTLISRPRQTIMVLISDLYEGSLSQDMLRLMAEIVASGVQCICLLALNDNGTPGYDHRNAAAMAAMGIPVFACTPDLFPDLMAAAIQRQDIATWAARNDIAVARAL